MRTSNKGILLFSSNSNGKFDICVTVIEVVQKLGCCVFIVEQGEGVVINGSIVTLTRPGLVLIHVLKD